MGYRRISTGFELANLNPGANAAIADVSVEAARSGNLGLAYRSNSNRYATYALDGAYSTGGATQAGYAVGWSVWLRIRSLTGTEQQWAGMQGLNENPSVGVFTISTGGEIKCYSVGSPGWAGRTLLWTSPALTTMVWYRFVMGYLSADPGACPHPPAGAIPPACQGNLTFALYDTGGSLVGSQSGTMAGLTNGLGASNARSCEVPLSPPFGGTGINAIILGQENITGVAQTGLELDLDDLILDTFTQANQYTSCNVEYNGSAPTDYSFDTFGTGDFSAFAVNTGAYAHYRLDPTALGGGVAGWENPVGTPFSQIFQSNLPPFREEVNNELVSSTSGSEAFLSVPSPASLGYVGAMKAVNVGAEFRITSGTHTWVVFTATAGTLTHSRAPGTTTAQTITFPRPGSLISFDSADAIGFGLRKSSDVTASRITSLALEVEIAASAPAVSSTDISMQTGEYTGTGDYLSIFTLWQPDWVFIAPVGSPVAGLIWHDGMVGAQGWSVQTNYAGHFRILSDGFAVTGTANTVNQSGQVYRYIALSDPSKRCLLRSGFSALSFSASRNVQEGGSFTPSYLWAHKEGYGADLSNGAYIRGLGHTGSNSSPLTSAQDTSGITNVIGTLFVAGTNLTNQTPQTAWTGWGTAGFTTYRIWDVVTYTGDGNPTKVVAVNLSGYAPGLALVTPHNGISYLRHPSHTGTNSETINGTNNTDAIRAFAANQLTVGSTLNANGIVYEVLVITAGDAGLPPGVPGPPGANPPHTPGGGDPPTVRYLTDPGPTGSAGLVLFANGSDSGGIAGCNDAMGNGTPSGGNGCIGDLGSGTDSHGSVDCTP